MMFSIVAVPVSISSPTFVILHFLLINCHMNGYIQIFFKLPFL